MKKGITVLHEKQGQTEASFNVPSQSCVTVRS